MNRIADVRTKRLSLLFKDTLGANIPYHVLYPIPHAQERPRDGAFATLVEIEDDKGRVGIGESLATMTPHITAEIIDRLLKPILLGQNSLDIEVLWQRMYRLNRLNGYSRGFMMEAISGVDIALWDLAGKVYQKPVYQLLGGAFRREIKAYASPVPIMEDLDEATGLAEQFVQSGFSAIKVKVGRSDIRDDIRLIERIRESVGEEVEIALDANGAYDVFTASTIGKRLEPYEIYWFEEPLPPEDVDAYVALKKNIRIPLAAGEAEATPYNYRDMVNKRAVDVVQPNIARNGGITAARRLSSLTDAHHLPIAPHGVGGAVFLAASLHLSAAIPNFLMIEYNRRLNPLRDDMTLAPFNFQQGCLQVPEGVGLGVELNPDFVQKHLETP